MEEGLIEVTLGKVFTPKVAMRSVWWHHPAVEEVGEHEERVGNEEQHLWT